MAKIEVAVSTHKVIHEFSRDEWAYYCGAARFSKSYLPTLDIAEVDDEGVLTEKSKRYLEGDGYRLCKTCFTGRGV